MSSPAPKPTAKAPAKGAQVNNNSSSSTSSLSVGILKREENDVIKKSYFTDFEKNLGYIEFICHVIIKTTDGKEQIIQAAKKPMDDIGNKGNSSQNHPDQRFFKENNFDLFKLAVKKGNKIIEFITDCSNMPCEDCFAAVPKLIRDHFGINSGKAIKITMYGHRPEGGGGKYRCVRVTDTDCKTGHTVEFWEWK